MMTDLAVEVVAQLRKDDGHCDVVLSCRSIQMNKFVDNGGAMYAVQCGGKCLLFESPWQAFDVFCMMACPLEEGAHPQLAKLFVDDMPMFDAAIHRDMRHGTSTRAIASRIVQCIAHAKIIRYHEAEGQH